MLNMTDAAGEHLVVLLDNANAPDEAAVRLVMSEGGLGMRADTAKPEDVTFEHDGRTVLLASKDVADALDGRTLDAVETENGTGLTIS